MEEKDLYIAHNFCMNHKEQLLQDKKCGCFSCMTVFEPKEINEWVEDKYGTAICPYCSIDSVIGESSGYPINKHFLSLMNDIWFGELAAFDNDEDTWDITSDMRAAKRGNLDAMYNVANYYCYGTQKLLSPRLKKRVLNYYLKAAEMGNCDAMLDLGGLYLTGKYVKKDREAAYYWYKKAERDKHPASYRCLGNLFFYDIRKNGFPVPTSNYIRIRKAYTYYRKGAELENSNCIYELGDMYLNGRCVPKDVRKAYLLYRKAYDIAKKNWYQYGYDDSLSSISFRLAKCFHYGLGTSRNISLASLYIEIAYKECMYWKKYNNKHNLVELRSIKKERKKIECDKYGTTIENLKKNMLKDVGLNLAVYGARRSPFRFRTAAFR